MINKLKISLLIAVLSLVGGVEYANAQTVPLTWSNDTSIVIGGNTYTISSGSTATSLVVDASSITVNVPSSNTFTLVSPNRHRLANNGGLTATCTSTESTLTISTASTVTITPNTTICTIPSGGGGYYIRPVIITPTTPTTPTTPVTPTTNPVITPGTIANAQASLTAIQAVTINLFFGSRGNDVKSLQRFLNNNGFRVAKFGAGSPGNESTYFGPATKRALTKLQKSLGLVADGFMGPKTLAKIKALVF